MTRGRWDEAHNWVEVPEVRLTVRALIEELQKLPADQLDWEVSIDGCDCEGPCGAPVVRGGDRVVSLPRGDLDVE